MAVSRKILPQNLHYVLRALTRPLGHTGREMEGENERETGREKHEERLRKRKRERETEREKRERESLQSLSCSHHIIQIDVGPSTNELLYYLQTALL